MNGGIIERTATGHSGNGVPRKAGARLRGVVFLLVLQTCADPLAACARAGGWEDAPSAVDGRPLFWETPLFVAACALLVLAVAFVLFRRRVRTLEARQEHLTMVIADQHRTEAALRTSQRRLKGLVDELEVKNAELERFAYAVSHDLKSPLVTILGFVGSLERDALDGNVDRMRTDTRRISAAATTMNRLLDELIELSRVGRQVNPPEEVPFGALVEQAAEALDRRLAERGVRVETSPDLPVLYGDRIRLLEVVLNLLENAVKFLGDQPEPKIEVGARRIPDEVAPVLFVRDNGIGVDRRYREKIFGLFERLNPDVEGTGVGLALVKRIVEHHGGRVWVESAGPGHGSTFCWTIPRR